MLHDDIKGSRINSNGDYEQIQQSRHTKAQEFNQERAIKESEELERKEELEKEAINKKEEQENKHKGFFDKIKELFS